MANLGGNSSVESILSKNQFRQCCEETDLGRNGASQVIGVQVQNSQIGEKSDLRWNNSMERI